MFPEPMLAYANAVLLASRKRGYKLAVAESCTGGLIGGLFTEISGSSEVFDRGYITYSNASKTELLGVKPELIAQHGAVSHEVAKAMAEGALKQSNCDLAVSVTGIAGPGGGTHDKPVGLVYIAVATKQKTIIERNFFLGSRNAIRLRSVDKALHMLGQALADVTS